MESVQPAFGLILYQAVVVPLAQRKKLGQGVRRCRQRAHLTMEQLGEKADLNPVYVGQIERGFKVPTVEALLRIARALHVRVRNLLWEL